MHPQLVEHNNPLCVEQIRAFKRCHEDAGYWGRLTGTYLHLHLHLHLHLLMHMHKHMHMHLCTCTCTCT